MSDRPKQVDAAPSVGDRVRQVASHVLGIPATDIDGDTSPDSIESWDSLKHMNLVLALEQEFGIRFTDERIVTMLSIQLIEDAVTEFLPPASNADQR